MSNVSFERNQLWTSTALSLCNNPKDRSSQLLCGWSLKSHNMEKADECSSMGRLINNTMLLMSDHMWTTKVIFVLFLNLCVNTQQPKQFWHCYVHTQSWNQKYLSQFLVSSVLEVKKYRPSFIPICWKLMELNMETSGKML